MRQLSGVRAVAYATLHALSIALCTQLGARRDGVDVITTSGAARTVRPALRVGLEAVGEDLEGLFDTEEAEGVARLMVGPTLRIALPNARWNVLLGGGPVIRLSGSTVSAAGPDAERDLQTRNGFVLRSSITYSW